ncbi:hypothetical protein NXH76_13085 [Blautia schinkii]|nr:hypothetical protein [Blautia schinkii]
MRKFFYGVSVILFLCVLSLGYYSTYKIGDANRRIAQQELLLQEEAQAARYPEADDGAAGENQDSGASTAASAQEGGYGLFYLKESDGYVMVYESDRKTLYEPTSILVSLLPENLRMEIVKGKYLKSQEELYSFLENYSS